jgi:hypothetical protein
MSARGFAVGIFSLWLVLSCGSSAPPAEEPRSATEESAGRMQPEPWRELRRVPLPGAPPRGPDRDGDGVPERADRCPGEPEDRDGFEDEDGCPDPDNDLDGAPDVVDACPMLPEDRDGKEDADGCPDFHQGADGVWRR